MSQVYQVYQDYQVYQVYQNAKNLHLALQRAISRNRCPECKVYDHMETPFLEKLERGRFSFELSIEQVSGDGSEREKPEAIVKHEEGTQLIYKAALCWDFSFLL